MDSTAHRLQCKTPHFPKHKFPIHATRNVQMKSTVHVPRFQVGGVFITRDKFISHFTVNFK